MAEVDFRRIIAWKKDKMKYLLTLSLQKNQNLASCQCFSDFHRCLGFHLFTHLFRKIWGCPIRIGNHIILGGFASMVAAVSFLVSSKKVQI